MKKKVLQKEGWSVNNVLNFITSAIGYTILAIAICMIVGLITCSLAHKDRATLLENYGNATLVARLENGLIDEKVELEDEVNGQRIVSRTYTFDDGTISKIPALSIVVNGERQGHKTLREILTGSDIKRQRATTYHGIPVVNYRARANVVYELPSGHTVHFDYLSCVINDEVNAQINSCYQRIKLGGIIVVLSLYVFFLAIILLILTYICKSLVKTSHDLDNQSIDTPKHGQHGSNSRNSRKSHA